MRVADLMKTDVKAVRTMDSLQQAAMVMWTHDLGALPVLADDDTVAGVITDRDIAMAAALREQTLDQIAVHATMSKDVWSCSADQTVVDAERLMRQHQVRRLPVLDSTGRVEGMISLNDIAHAAASGPTRPLAGHVARTLDAITSPRPHADPPA